MARRSTRIGGGIAAASSPAADSHGSQIGEDSGEESADDSSYTESRSRARRPKRQSKKVPVAPQKRRRRSHSASIQHERHHYMAGLAVDTRVHDAAAPLGHDDLGQLLQPRGSTRRPYQFPPCYEVIGKHSQHHLRRFYPNARCFVFLVDTHVMSMDEWLEVGEKLEIARPDPESLDAAGFFEFLEGDLVLARDLHGDGAQLEDRLVLMYSGSMILNAHEIQNLHQAILAILGPEDKIGIGEPVLQGREIVGGTLLERLLSMTKIKGARCYSLTATGQDPNMYFSPAADWKIGTQDPEGESLRQALIQAASVFSAAAHRHTPAALQKHVQNMADLTNQPILGVAGNFASAVQLNLSNARPNGQAELVELGPFGDTEGHHDGKDSPSAVTHMVHWSNIPEHAQYSQSIFVLRGIGGYIRCTSLCAVSFSGQQLHFNSCHRGWGRPNMATSSSDGNDSPTEPPPRKPAPKRRNSYIEISSDDGPKAKPNPRPKAKPKPKPKSRAAPPPSAAPTSPPLTFHEGELLAVSKLDEVGKWSELTAKILGRFPHVEARKRMLWTAEFNAKTVKAQYLMLCRAYHPDSNANLDVMWQDVYEKITKVLTARMNLLERRGGELSQ